MAISHGAFDGIPAPRASLAHDGRSDAMDSMLAAPTPGLEVRCGGGAGAVRCVAVAVRVRCGAVRVSATVQVSVVSSSHYLPAPNH
jgi:hypothetical protein